jgi:predicted transcriptional regulator
LFYDECIAIILALYQKNKTPRNLQVFHDMDETNKDVFLYILSDKFSRQILNCILAKPKSAAQISAECNILLSMVYRRLQYLEESGILQTTGEITEDGKKRFTYLSKVGEISALFNGNNVYVTAKPNLRT